MDLLIRWLLNALALALTAWIVPGIDVAGVGALIVAALVIGLLNALVKPVLVVLTLPITILTLGIFLLVLNALLFWLAAAIVPGFSVAGFLAALLGAVVMAILGWVFAKLA
ncbi:MAG: phage holin family protein [Gemmatimonadota bacterium]|nr:phage holin family protein [Gemmatimonadota bacterium]